MTGQRKGDASPCSVRKGEGFRFQYDQTKHHLCCSLLIRSLSIMSCSVWPLSKSEYTSAKMHACIWHRHARMRCFSPWARIKRHEGEFIRLN